MNFSFCHWIAFWWYPKSGWYCSRFDHRHCNECHCVTLKNQFVFDSVSLHSIHCYRFHCSNRNGRKNYFPHWICFFFFKYNFTAVIRINVLRSFFRLFFIRKMHKSFVFFFIFVSIVLTCQILFLVDKVFHGNAIFLCAIFDGSLSGSRCHLFLNNIRNMNLLCNRNEIRGTKGKRKITN